MEKYWTRKVSLDAYAWGMGIEENIFIYFPQGIEPRTDNETWTNYKDSEMSLSYIQQQIVRAEIDAVSSDRYAPAPLCAQLIAQARKNANLVTR